MGEKHVFGLSQTLAFERWRFSLVALSLKPNGPAIKCVCVGRRSTAIKLSPLARKLSRCKRGHGALFASQGRNFLSYTSVAVQT